MQTLPATTQLRDAWEDATDDGVICAREMATITRLIVRADDGVRHALTVLKGGPDTRRSRESRDDFERLHGPIRIETYQHAKRRRSHGNGNDAA